MNKNSYRHLSKVQSLPNITTARPKLKKEISNNNSSTTNDISVEKNLNSNNNFSTVIHSQNMSHNKNVQKSILLHKIRLNNYSKSQRSISKSWILPDSINTAKGSLEIMQRADDILKERERTHDRDFAMRRHKLKTNALRVSRRICRKNYLINSLKQRRTEIINKEFFIQKALREFELKLEIDRKRFINFMEDVKVKQKKDETRLIDFKTIRYEAEDRLEEEERKNNILQSKIYKEIKEIYTQKDFGAFVHGILETDFFYNNLPDLKKSYQDNEFIADILINKFEQIENFDDFKKGLENVNIYFKKSELMEKEIMKTIHEKLFLKKDILIFKNNSENEIKQLKVSLGDYQSDYNYILDEINLVQTEMENYKINESLDFDLYLKYIEELGLELGLPYDNSQGEGKTYMNEFIVYSKNVINELKNTENKVNEMISEIENIIELGNKKDTELMMKKILNQKNINKKEKLLLFRQKKEELKVKQKLKIIERERKPILKGRMVIYDYPTGKIPKSKIKNKEIEKESTGNSNTLKENLFSDK